MNRMKIRMGLAILGVSALAAPTAFAAPAKDANTGKNPTVECENALGEPTGDTIAFGGPDYLWPPNHKYRTITVTATAGGLTGASDYVKLSTVGTHDEYLNAALEQEQNGTGNTFSDVDPFIAPAEGSKSATSTQKLRGERSGNGDGRTYTFKAKADFSATQTPFFANRTCSAEFTVVVPHDQSGKTRRGKLRLRRASLR